MDLSPLHFFTSNEGELLLTWSYKTDRWIVENFVLLGVLWSDLPSHLKERLSRFTRMLVDGLKSLSLAQSPEAIVESLHELLKNLEKNSSLEPSIIVGFSVVNGSISPHGNVEFPVLQLLASKISKDASFPRLLILLSPKLRAFTFQLSPREICNCIHLHKVKTVLEEKLRILRSIDLPDGFTRAVFVEWVRIAYRLAAMGLIESILDYFATGFEFLVRLSCGNSRSASLAFRFVTLPLYNRLRMARSELHHLIRLPVSQICQGNLLEIINVCQSVASAFAEPELASTVIRLSKDFLLHCAYWTNLSTHRLTDLLNYLFPMQSEDSVKKWLRFWLVADISGDAFPDAL